MLVLSRRSGEAITFPSLGIEVRVTSVIGHVVKLGVVAPQHIRVWRNELLPQTQPGQSFEKELAQTG